MADEHYHRNRYGNENEGYQNRNEGNEEEEEYEEVEEGGKGKLTGFLILFIILFVVSTGLLTYFQFIQPDGSFALTFEKQAVSKSDLKALKQENKQLTQLADSLKEENERSQQVLDSLKMASSGGKGQQVSETSMSGQYYVVQIGAFESFSFDRYGDNVTNLKFNKDNGVLKITLGKFKEANAARAFRRDLAKLGLEDAFIYKMKDGERVGVVESYSS